MKRLILIAAIAALPLTACTMRVQVEQIPPTPPTTIPQPLPAPFTRAQAADAWRDIPSEKRQNVCRLAKEQGYDDAYLYGLLTAVGYPDGSAVTFAYVKEACS